MSFDKNFIMAILTCGRTSENLVKFIAESWRDIFTSSDSDNDDDDADADNDDNFDAANDDDYDDNSDDDDDNDLFWGGEAQKGSRAHCCVHSQADLQDYHCLHYCLLLTIIIWW